MLRKTLKVFYPKKYFERLSSKQKTQRKKEIEKYGSMSSKSKNAYVGFKTDKNIKTKKSILITETLYRSII